MDQIKNDMKAKLEELGFLKAEELATNLENESFSLDLFSDISDDSLRRAKFKDGDITRFRKHYPSKGNSIYSIRLLFAFYDNRCPFTLYYIIFRVCLYDYIPSSHSYYR